MDKDVWKERIAANIKIDPESGCWEWTGSRSSTGVNYSDDYKVTSTPLYAHPAPVPAVPDDVAEQVARLREAYALVAEFPENKPDGFMNLLALRNLTPAAADTIEAQAAELARIKTAANKLVNHPGWGTVNYTDGDMWADADALRAALAKGQQP